MLDMSHNQLRALIAETFEGLELERLYLQDNNLGHEWTVWKILYRRFRSKSCN